MGKSNLLAGNDGLVLVLSYFALFVVNSAVVSLANLFFPQVVVLGTQSLSPLWALGLSMGVLALINTFVLPLVRIFENKRKRMLNTNEWMLLYFVLNFAGVWLITRGAKELGLGITSWAVALVLAVVLDLAQGVIMMELEKMKKQS